MMRMAFLAASLAMLGGGALAAKSALDIQQSVVKQQTAHQVGSAAGRSID